MTGDLDIRLSENNLRTFGVSDANSHGETVSLLLGNINNQIKYSYNEPLKIIASNGTSINCLGDNGVLRPVCVFSDIMSEFNGDVSLNSHKISLLSDPVSDSDAVNKSYLLHKINSIREFNNDMSMKGYSIMNLKNPIALADASTKKYVDTCIAAQAAQIPQALADPVDQIHLSNK